MFSFLSFAAFSALGISGGSILGKVAFRVIPGVIARRKAIKAVIRSIREDRVNLTAKQAKEMGISDAGLEALRKK